MFRAERWYPIANATIQHRMRVYDYYEPGNGAYIHIPLDTSLQNELSQPEIEWDPELSHRINPQGS